MYILHILLSTNFLFLVFGLRKHSYLSGYVLFSLRFSIIVSNIRYFYYGSEPCELLLIRRIFKSNQQDL